MRQIKVLQRYLRILSDAQRRGLAGSLYSARFFILC